MGNLLTSTPHGPPTSYPHTVTVVTNRARLKRFTLSCPMEVKFACPSIKLIPVRVAAEPGMDLLSKCEALVGRRPKLPDGLFKDSLMGSPTMVLLIALLTDTLLIVFHSMLCAINIDIYIFLCLTDWLDIFFC